jgi:hypothetical protein
MDHIVARDNPGNDLIASSNSFAVLHDEYIVDKALEVGIDVNSLHIQTVHLLKEWENARACLFLKNKILENEKSSKGVSSNIIKESEGEETKNRKSGDESGEEFYDIEDDFTLVSKSSKKKLKKKSSSKKKQSRGVP